MAIWQLITGTTGLLGQHLLIDMLRRRKPMAVMVRSKPGIDSYERVDRMISGWESRLGTVLQRPIVMNGEITAEGLGLSSQDSEWCQRNVRSVVHCAASVKFQAAGPNLSEPMKSNVEGTSRLLKIFEKSNLEEFHYVSTAYTCGHVTDGSVVAEKLHPLTTPFRNIYEESKCKAEHLVMSAAGEFSRSIYRPAIIVGHSADGYSPSFNALYKSLQFIWMLVKEYPFAFRYREAWMKHFGIGEDDSRNVVPVDWVSAAMVELIQRKEPGGQIFHLTNPHPILNREIILAMEDVISQNIQVVSQDLTKEASFLESLDLMNDQFDVYRSYFSVDPTFDTTNVSQVASCPPCPTLQTEDMIKMFSYAVRADFRNQDFRGEARSATSSYPVFRRLMSKPVAYGKDRQKAGSHAAESSIESTGATNEPQVRLAISGSGGGTWQIRLVDGQIDCRLPDDDDDLCSLVYTTSGVFQEWLRGAMSLNEALQSGAIVLIGPEREANRTHELLLKLREALSRAMSESEVLAFAKLEGPRAALVTGGAGHVV